MGKKNSANKENPETFGNTDLNLDENFYDVGDIKKEQDDQKDYEKSKKKKIIVIIILAVILAVLVFFLIFKSGLFKKDNTPKPEISLLSKELNLKNGESANISFTILNTSVNGTASFESSDSSVVTVDNNGKVVAVGEGKAIITVIYDIEGKKITNTCNVVVEKVLLNQEIMVKNLLIIRQIILVLIIHRPILLLVKLILRQLLL